MSTKTYELMNLIFQENDLVNCGYLLVEFANIAYKDKNRATIVKKFYERLYNWLINKFYFYSLLDSEKKNYFICDSNTGANRYLALFTPEKTSAAKSLNNIIKFGENLILQFTKPIGKLITESSIENILQFLEKEYLFTSKVFSKSEAIFILINNSHKIYNSECLILNNDEYNRNLFFLYHMKKKKSISPEAVFFHELGHALHAQYSGDVKKVPDDIINFLQVLCFPRLKQVDNEEQSELFADVLSVGLMYQTPYEKFDSYKTIHQNDKKEFKNIVEKIIESL